MLQQLFSSLSVGGCLFLMEVKFIFLLTILVVQDYESTVSVKTNLPSALHAIYESHRQKESNLSAKEASSSENELPQCYGFETNCDASKRYRPNFPHSCNPREHWNYWIQGDFGYIRRKLDSLFPACVNGPSFMTCTEWMQLCLAKQIYLDLTEMTFRQGPVHVEDVFQKGQIGGDCHVDKEAILRQSLGKNLDGRLRSWYSELKEFSRIDGFALNQSFCDILIDKPVVFMKWDQGNNMYHRICDFLNLYISLLSNNSFHFDTDILIVSWNWTTRPYNDYFADSLKVFTRNPVVNLHSWFGKRVCFSSAIFSFLPRMLLGLYYNTPLGENCWGSGLVKSFSELFLHRLNIPQDAKPKDHTRVTFLIRRDYGHSNRKLFRQILNLEELIEDLRNISDIELKVVDFEPQAMTFTEQLRLISNTDIFLSIHGAGMTHLLFLPDWAVVFELFDCEAKCYRDLARLRGIHHVTWEDQSKLTKHDNENERNLRYYNYSFDRNEFKRLFLRAKTLQEKQNTITRHIEL